MLRELVILFVKGIIIGFSNIVPGVSSGALLVSFRLYERFINIFSNFFKNFKQNLRFILPILLGITIGMISGGKAIYYALDNFKTQTILLFVGLIFGGISLITKKVRGNINKSNLFIFFVIFFLVLIFNFLPFRLPNVSFNSLSFLNYLALLFIGIIASFGIVPGISTSFILMLFGYYDKVMNAFSNIFNFSNFIVLFIFIIGLFIGVLLISKLFKFILDKYEVRLYFAMFGFVLSSLVILILEIDSFKLNVFSIITCIISFSWGFLLAKAIDKE